MAVRLKERREAETLRAAAIEAALARSRRKDRETADLLLQVMRERGGGDWDDAPDVVQTLARFLRYCPDKVANAPLQRLVLHVEATAPRLLRAAGPAGQQSYIPALLRMVAYSHLWVRAPEEWHPNSHSPQRLFGQLARYLFADYRVPAFMDSVFYLRGVGDQVPWFHHVGTGKNIRTAPGLTAPLTKKMAHHFLGAPEGCDVVDAVRRGQLLGLGGSEQLVDRVLKSWMVRGLLAPAEEEWWLTVLQWLVNHPELPPDQVAPLLDYLRNRRDGTPLYAIAPDRDFSMKGRSVSALLRLMAEWHREINRREGCPRGLSFKPSGVQGGQWATGEGTEACLWTIREVLSSGELLEEGRSMGHCVATYADAVTRGTSSIWVLRAEHYQLPPRALTIELNPNSRKIVQARGRFNRDPQELELHILERWAAENGLILDL